MKRLTAALAGLVVSVLAWAQGTIKVEVHDVVGVDERFNVAFVVEGDAPSSFEWAPSDDFQLVWGPQKGSSTSVSMINGKVSKSSTTTYTYILLPKKTGTFQLPAATAKVKGGEISSRPFRIEVVSNGGTGGSRQTAPSQSQPQSQPQATGEVSSEDIFMRLSLSRRDVVVGEPVTATLKLYQRANIVGFEDAKFPSFNGFWSKETDTPQNVEFRREALGDKIYDAALLRRWVLIPQKSGTLQIDPAEIVCLVNVQTARRGSSIFDSFFEDGYTTIRKRVTTPAVSVRVSQLPAGAPASFSGGVGEYTVTARLSKDSLKTHDAASLLVTVSGKGNISLLEAPKINFPPDFDVYDVKTTPNVDKAGTTGSKTFEYPFIPRSAGDFTVDPVKYSFYNVNTKRYATVATDSLRLRVAKAPGTESTVVSGGQTLVVDRKGVKNLGEDIRFIRTRNEGFRTGHNFLVGRPLYWGLIAALTALAVLFWLAFRKVAARRADVIGTKNRRATKMALKRLHLAGDFLGKGLQTAFYEELHRALLGFVSDKLTMDMADQTKENIAAALAERGISEGLAREFTDLLDACEYARYAPDAGHEAMNSHYQKAVDVITAIDSNMKKPVSKAGAALLALLLLAPATLHAEALSYPDSLWQAGVNAYTEGQYAEAAAAWQGILDAGLSSADLYYNAGNAYFKLGETGKAILNYERAARLDPASADIRYNLDFARGTTQDRIDSVPEFFLEAWGRKACYLLPSNVWAVLSIVFFALTLSLVLLFLLGPSSAARKAGFFTGIVTLLIALLGWDFAHWQKREAESADEAVVMRAVSPVKSSPSGDNAAKDLFILHEGTKVRLLDTVGSWHNIELADGRQGWLRASDVEVI